MNLRKTYSKLKSSITHSTLPSEGERYYDVLFGSEFEVTVIRDDRDVIVITYADDERRHPCSTETWEMAVESGRFERVENTA